MYAPGSKILFVDLDTYPELEREFVGVCILAGADIHLEPIRSAPDLEGERLWYYDRSKRPTGKGSAVTCAREWCNLSPAGDDIMSMYCWTYQGGTFRIVERARDYRHD